MYLRHTIFHDFSFTASILKIEIFRQVENLFPKKGVSVVNANSANFQLYHGEIKLI